MALPEQLDHCPITPECAAKRLYRTDGKLYRYDSLTHVFVDHVCSTSGTESTLPALVYMGEWLNTRTKRTRFHGPFRSKASAMKPPPDGGKQRKRSKLEQESEWSLTTIHRSSLAWKELKE